MPTSAFFNSRIRRAQPASRFFRVGVASNQRTNDADSPVLFGRAPDTGEARGIVQALRESGRRVAVPPTDELRHLAGARRRTKRDGQTLIELWPTRRSVRTEVAKRVLDVAGALLLLTAVAPAAVLIALAIKLDSPGPVLFRQRRIGRNGRPFAIVKLRTMSRDAELRRSELLAQSKDAGWLHLEHDPRVTRVGRILRRLSLDEFPQLWNVLRGEMSLVGPRPLIEQEGSRLPSWARARAEVRPGMTGPWQVMGRTDIPFNQMLVLDWAYSVTHSLAGDLMLLIRTVPALLGGRGAN